MGSGDILNKNISRKASIKNTLAVFLRFSLYNSSAIVAAIQNIVTGLNMLFVVMVVGVKVKKILPVRAGLKLKLKSQKII